MVWTLDKIEKSFERICDHISQGNSLNSALELHDTPDKNTFYNWIDHTRLKEPSEEVINNAERRFNHYARAIRERADVMFEEIIQISEDRGDCSYFDDQGNKRIDSAAVQAKRAEIDTKKWALSKMQPKKYGDKIDYTTGGEKIQQSTVINLGGGKNPDEGKN